MESPYNEDNALAKHLIPPTKILSIRYRLYLEFLVKGVQEIPLTITGCQAIGFSPQPDSKVLLLKSTYLCHQIWRNLSWLPTRSFLPID